MASTRSSRRSSQQALADKSPDVRAAAHPAVGALAAPSGEPHRTAAVLKLTDDPSWTVRRQLAASIGELPQAARARAAAAML